MSIIPIPPVGTTELDAVNTLLSVVGELPVTTLEGPLNSDALIARRTIQDVVVEFQNREWHFNTEEDFDLIPDVNGEIIVAQSVRNIDVHPLQSLGIDVVLRGQRLYDRKNHTYTFDSPLKAKITHCFAFDDLPQSAKNYVVAWAAMKFQGKVLGVADLHTALKEDFLRAERTFRAEDIRNANMSILETTPNSRMGYNSVHRILRRR